MSAYGIADSGNNGRQIFDGSDARTSERAASRQAVTARGAREHIKYEHGGYANKAADPILVD
jgi:hypothetical protein